MSGLAAKLSESDLAEFERLVLGVAGITMDRVDSARRRSAVAQAWADSGIENWAGFLSAAQDAVGGRRIVEDAVGRLTVKETYFFRSPRQFHALMGTVLEEIALARPMKGVFARRPLRIWSAGCATGEETYSIAASIAESLQYPGSWDLSVLGTDISTEALEVARLAEYPRARLAAESTQLHEVLAKHLVDVHDRGFRISDSLRRTVRFERLNLAADPYPEDQDVIFCRNVMIYFPLKDQPALLDRLFAALRPGGWLFLGDAELLHVHSHGFEGLQVEGALVYRKPGGPELDAASTRTGGGS